MVIIYLFILSGLGLTTLLIAKRMEEKRRIKPFILELICKGDAMLRELRHEAILFYSTLREDLEFLFKKQIPMKSRSSLNKCLAMVHERTENYFESLRDSRLLKKSDGISDFFKNMSSVEKGKGEINEEIYTEEPRAEEAGQPIEFKFEIIQPVIEVPKAPKVKRARKAPSARRKLKVVESIEL
jgi:hypothetical protein